MSVLTYRHPIGIYNKHVARRGGGAVDCLCNVETIQSEHERRCGIPLDCVCVCLCDDRCDLSIFDFHISLAIAVIVYCRVQSIQICNCNSQ